MAIRRRSPRITSNAIAGMAGSGRRLTHAAETAQAAATTIAFRLPRFMYDVLDPSHPMSAETRRAFSEKAAAAMEGGVAAFQAWQLLWMDMAIGRVKPEDLPKAMNRVVDAGLAPANRRVRANAKRLSKSPAKSR